MTEHLLPVRALQALFRAVWRRRHDAPRPVALQEPSRVGVFHDFTVRRREDRPAARHSFRYLRLEACDH